MLAVAGDLRVMLLSRHLPLRDALALVEPERVAARLRLLDETLRGLGIERPRLALAGLNPHAGEGGLLGEEEGRVLEPVARRLREEEGLDVTGPVSPDSVFLAAAAGAYDGVLALYHDQAFIPVKLLSKDRGLTVIAGLPYPRQPRARHGVRHRGQGGGVERQPAACRAPGGEWAAASGAGRFPSTSWPAPAPRWWPDDASGH